MDTATVDAFIRALTRVNPGVTWQTQELERLRQQLLTEQTLKITKPDDWRDPWWIEPHGCAVLPAELGTLTELRELTLIGTRLASLPPQISQLKQLQTLHIRDCPLHSLPPEIA